MKNTINRCTVTIPNIDLELLKKQKIELLKLLRNKDAFVLNGLISLIDEIQDIAFEENFFFKEKDVYLTQKH